MQFKCFSNLLIARIKIYKLFTFQNFKMTKIQTSYKKLNPLHRLNPEKHHFHLVDSSLLPITTAFSIFILVLSLVFHWHSPNTLPACQWDFWYFCKHLFGLILFLINLFAWFVSVVRESNAGHHTMIVQRGLKLGMILFIISEILFFFAFFWAFFHFSLAPSVLIGATWPPKGVQSLDPWGLPLVNTLLLLSSGVTITLAHRAILSMTGDYHRYLFLKHLFATIVLGVTFLLCQAIEYKYGITFSWKDHVYGSIFFVLTGFHGFHVTVGTLFLLFCFFRESWFLFFKKKYGLLFTYLYHKHKHLPAILASDKLWKNVQPIVRFHYWSRVHQWLTDFDKNLISDPVTPAEPNLRRVHSHFAAIHLFVLPPQVHKLLITIETPTGWEKSKNQNAHLAWLEMQREWRKSASTATQHLGFEAAAWYWHFVDVVWLFLFVVVYWWGC